MTIDTLLEQNKNYIDCKDNNKQNAQTLAEISLYSLRKIY
ncbi:hypothetical protein BTHERMOSOX_1970 [Bathymodiolus thermophilus thioautotrophic gill symbiont]|nr:hypothetical protein BTHERMOSOX_1970 [Bathymodiolus thermophilus thioautotrophic gill symbiont]